MRTVTITEEQAQEMDRFLSSAIFNIYKVGETMRQITGGLHDPAEDLPEGVVSLDAARRARLNRPARARRTSGGAS